MNPAYQNKIEAARPYCLTETSLPFGKKFQGKVRDMYDLGDKLIIISTDRQSAFDRILAAVPYKGQVLNQCSKWWFERSSHIIPNHLLAVPHPNVSIVKKCKVFPVEFVVRGYISGSTKTSLWTRYQAGDRTYCGLDFPEGLQKNQKLSAPVITATSKGIDEDRPLSPDEIIAKGLMNADEWQQAADAALALFEFGSELAAAHGLILVDTKYEFAKDAQNKLVLVDEIHTPDSSRYWIAGSYDSRFAQGLEPENIDKEFLRLWFANHSNPYQDAVLPEAPFELICELSSRYIQLYEMITGRPFSFPKPQESAMQSILEHVTASYKTIENK